MASLKKCVENMCKSCSYDPTQSGSWRSQTENCSVKKCPLWEVRPVTMETVLARRANKSDAADIDALIDNLPDET